MTPLAMPPLRAGSSFEQASVGRHDPSDITDRASVAP
jgi:hypothetical protein